MHEILFRVEGLAALGFVWAMYLPRLAAESLQEVLRGRSGRAL
jgi:hypothetical protein